MLLLLMATSANLSAQTTDEMKTMVEQQKQILSTILSPRTLLLAVLVPHSGVKCYKTEEPPISERLRSALFVAGRNEKSYKMASL